MQNTLGAIFQDKTLAKQCCGTLSGDLAGDSGRRLSPETLLRTLKDTWSGINIQRCFAYPQNMSSFFSSQIKWIKWIQMGPTPPASYLAAICSSVFRHRVAMENRRSVQASHTDWKWKKIEKEPGLTTKRTWETSGMNQYESIILFGLHLGLANRAGRWFPCRNGNALR